VNQRGCFTPGRVGRSSAFPFAPSLRSFGHQWWRSSQDGHLRGRVHAHRRQARRRLQLGQLPAEQGQARPRVHRRAGRHTRAPSAGLCKPKEFGAMLAREIARAIGLRAAPSACAAAAPALVPPPAAARRLRVSHPFLCLLAMHRSLSIPSHSKWWLSARRWRVARSSHPSRRTNPRGRWWTAR
jgi:hypothetical protein